MCPRSVACAATAEQLLSQAITRLKLSAGAYHRILKIARTIADLDGGGEILSYHVSEAIQNRSLDHISAAEPTTLLR